MGAIGGILSALGSILGGIASIFGALKSDIEIPELPTFKIPEEDLRILTEQIKANTAISEEARKAAVEALHNYNLGRLSPTYEALYNEYARERTRRVMQELAARGFTEGSTEYQRAMADLATELMAYRAQLLRQQLNDALSVAGLSETTVKELYDKWRAQADITGLEMQRRVAQYEMELGKRGLEAQKYGMLGEALETLGRGLEDILKPRVPEETKPTPTPEKTTAERLRGFYETQYSLADLIPKIKIKPEEEKEG